MSKKSPYDRDTTSMSLFPMCEKCRDEYTDPTNRRYHAQTIACHDCGPQMRLYDGVELTKEGTDISIVEKVASIINNDEIIAIKGVGGFHLVCNTKPETVLKLKKISKRTDKPFALLCKDIEMVQSIAKVTNFEIEKLTSIERPIVVLKKKVELKEVTELNTVGCQLESTALHSLLFKYINEPLVMTSSNISGQPISKTKEEQFTRFILDHTRNIENVADDSLVKIINANVFYLRRSRGYVPRSFEVKNDSKKQILACGAEINNTFSVYKNGRITQSQYLGNTSNFESFQHYKKTLRKFLDFTDVKPDIICTDLHPDFNTSIFGRELALELGAKHVEVQHHIAHAYSVAMEHNINDFTAIIFDGLGYGEDRTIWGGEIFNNNERVGHLEQQIQLGGDSATVHPYKMTYSILRKFLTQNETKQIIKKAFSDTEYTILDNELKERLYSPLTSSCGRVLDAASALLGICIKKTYEGRPAVLLESVASIPYDIKPVIVNNVLMTTPLFEYLVKNIDKDTTRLAATVEMYLAKGMYKIANQYNKPILWSGGCAYNTHITQYFLNKGVLINKNIPSGDGGVSVGQIGYILNKIKE